MNSKMTNLFAIALDIQGRTLKKVMLITKANQQPWKELHPKRMLDNVIALRKIQKDTDV